MNPYTQPDYTNCALITIDTQNDFSLLGAVAEIKGTSEVIPNIVKVLEVFRKQNKPIIHIVRIYKTDGSNVDLARKQKIEQGANIVSPNSEGAELVKELKPNEIKLDATKLLNSEFQEIASHEYVIYKPRWGAFYNTPLKNFLRDKGITTLVFMGCNFPNCPRTSIYEASERDFKIVVVTDGISGVYDKGIEEMKNIGCQTLQTDELVTILTKEEK